MQIQINTNHSIEVNELLTAHVCTVVKNTLSRFSDHITRVEVHISDESSQKATLNDKRCMMEARLEGRQPLSVSQNAATFRQAIGGAADKLSKLVGRTITRLHDKRVRASAANRQEQHAN